MIFILEIKKLLKTPMILFLLLLSIIFSVLLAYLPVTFEYAAKRVDGGKVSAESIEVEELKGFAAIEKNTADTSVMAGEITIDTLKSALAAYKECLDKYGATSQYELPEGVYFSELYGYYKARHILREVYADPESGIAPELYELDEAELDNFYERRAERFESLMAQERRPESVRAMMRKMYEKVEAAGLFYYPYYNTNALDYESLLMFVALLLALLIAAPVFASDTQTGADDIQRCARHGGVRLVLAKCGAVGLITGVMYAVSLLIYNLLTRCFYGSGGMASSIQSMLSIYTLEPWTLGELMINTAVVGLVCCLSAVALTLLLSVRVRSVGAAVGSALLLGLLPLLLDTLIGGRLSDWLCALIPSGGMCLQKSFYYAIYNLDFLTVGSLAMPTDRAIALFTAVELPIFLLLTLRAYRAKKY